MEIGYRDIIHFAIIFISAGCLLSIGITHLLLYKSYGEKIFKTYAIYLFLASLYPILWFGIALTKQPFFPWPVNTGLSPLHSFSENIQILIYMYYLFFLKEALNFDKWNNKFCYKLYKIAIAYHLFYSVVLIGKFASLYSMADLKILTFASRILLLGIGVIFWVITFRNKISTFYRYIGYGSLIMIAFGILSSLKTYASIGINGLLGCDYVFIGFLLDAFFFSAAVAYKSKEKAKNYTNTLLQKIELEKKLANEKIAFQNSLLQAQIQERNRIAKDMHDDVGADLSGIRFIANRIISKKQMDVDAVQNIRQLTDDAVEKMNEIIWALNQAAHSVEDIIYFTRSKCAGLCSSADIAFDFKCNKLIPEIQLTWQQSRYIYLMVKEAVNNALKHSKGSCIHLIFEIEPSTLKIKICDNGVGFSVGEAQSNSNGNGLHNFSKRAKEINAEINVISSPKNGCSVNIKVPL